MRIPAVAGWSSRSRPGSALDGFRPYAWRQRWFVYSVTSSALPTCATELSLRHSHFRLTQLGDDLLGRE